ncbi:MAG TPA: nucleotidyltransferase domain-containing protein [Syntrophomonadaceae bacterium]|nr:nucleotidyltransferase domain-containing protein [Syntrophomonadaceae bacterium]
MYLQQFQEILKELHKAVKEVYGGRLVTLAVFGSVGRNTPRPDSDIDLLIIADDLPHGRIKRVREFDLVEEKLKPLLERMWQKGIQTSLSPIIKEPNDVLKGSLIFLDMLDDARILYDRNGFFRNYLDDLRKRLDKLGAKKVYRGGAWYWVLKEDYKIGEEFEI